MLNQLRNLTKTWVAAFFVALLVASFAIWGVGDIFTARTPDAAPYSACVRSSGRQAPGPPSKPDLKFPIRCSRVPCA